MTTPLEVFNTDSIDLVGHEDEWFRKDREEQQNLRQRIDSFDQRIDILREEGQTLRQRINSLGRSIENLGRLNRHLQDSEQRFQLFEEDDATVRIPCSLTLPTPTTIVSTKIHSHDHMHHRNHSHRHTISVLDCRVKSALTHPAKKSKTEWKCPKCKRTGYVAGQWWGDGEDALRFF